LDTTALKWAAVLAQQWTRQTPGYETRDSFNACSSRKKGFKSDQANGFGTRLMRCSMGTMFRSKCVRTSA
jgi:hypothetical protein